MLRSSNYSRTEASTEPIAVSDLALARIEHHEHDDELRLLIAEGRRLCEERLGDVCLIDQVCIDYFDKFIDGMELHYSLVDSITSITYTDSDGDTQTLGTSIYELGTVNGMGVIRLKHNQTWPTTRTHEDVVKVTYTAGFGTASDVPELIKRWLKYWVQYQYDELPWDEQLDGLLSPFRTAQVISA